MSGSVCVFLRKSEGGTGSSETELQVVVSHHMEINQQTAKKINADIPAKT